MLVISQMNQRPILGLTGKSKKVTKSPFLWTDGIEQCSSEIFCNLLVVASDCNGEYDFGLIQQQFGIGGKKMNSKKVLTVMAAVLMVFALAFTAEARRFGHNQGMKGNLGGLRLLLQLKLSDAQQTEMMNILNKYQSEREALWHSMREARKGVAAVLRAEPFNEKEAREAFKKAANIKEDMFMLRAKMMTELKAVLTPEQVELLKERRAQRLERTRYSLANPFENPSE
jgi:Spy/CpxP family protein refolding chaperone